ncbi:MAG TPA: hypothetical protein VFB13_08140 [Reyranella sp.]|jgi:hypothetical protein|nr:hypothetical protein [Reyranella sp.]
MARYPLEWGWHTDPKNDTDPSESADWSRETQQRYPLEWGWDAPAEPKASALPTFMPAMRTLPGSPSLAPSIILVKSDSNDRLSPGSSLATPPRRGTAPNVEPTPDNPAYQAAMDKAVGHVVTLPDGSRVEDPTSETGYLMSPVPNLQAVATAGRRIRTTSADMMKIPETASGTIPYAMWQLGKYVGHGGQFDYQREANPAGGWIQYPHFRNVSNFNVGLLGHQAGISQGTLLWIAGALSALSGRPDFTQPYFLKKQTADFIRKGYGVSESGVFDEPSPP